MGLGDFWLQSNNGKKYNLDDFKDFKLEDNAQNAKFKKIINIFDADGSGTIEAGEWQSIFTELKKAAKDDVLSDRELGLYLSGKLSDEDVTVEDLKTFLNIAANRQMQELSYTEDGISYVDKYEDDQIVERIISNLDDQGNEVKTTVYYENGRIVKQIKVIDNEIVATIDYDYSQDPENPTTTTVMKDENGVIEQIMAPDRCELTIYKVEKIDDLDKSTSKKLQHTILTDKAQYIAEYDGNGNTYIVVQQGETLQIIAKKFGVSIEDLLKLNEDLKRDTILQPGRMLIVPSEIGANDKKLIGRKSRSEIMSKTYNKILVSVLDKCTIEEEDASADVYEYATKYLLKLGAQKTDKDFNERVNDLANELIMLNGIDAQYTAGQEITYISKSLDATLIGKLRELGIVPNAATNVFLTRFCCLAPQQQQNVIDVLTECKANGITDYGQINAEITKYYPEIQLFETDINVLQKPTDAMARKYMAYYLLEQIESIIAMYNQVATADQSLWTIGTGIVVEIGDLLHNAAKFLNNNLGTNFEEGDCRASLGPMLEKLREDCYTLIAITNSEEKYKDESFDKKKTSYNYYADVFNQKYSEMFRFQEVDYDALGKYLEALQEFQQASEEDRNNKDSAVYKKFEEATSELNERMPGFKDVSQKIESWGDFSSVTGGLVDLAIQVAMLYMSGGSSIIANSSMYMGNAARYSIGTAMGKVATSRFASTALGRFAVKEGTQFVVKESGAILTSMITSSAETAAFFQGTKVLAALEDGRVTNQEVAIIQEGFEGLFKFGMVGSMFAGPIGKKASEMVGKMLNSERAIASTMKLAVEGEGTTLDKVLKALSENSNAISKITEFGVSFSINAGYMAMSDNMGYGEAMGSLAEMDAVSKLVVAMLGGKNTAFLTPQKVQKIKASLAGYKVELSMYRGEKVYEVTDKNGAKVHLANEQELYLYILDLELKELANVEIPNEKGNGKKPNMGLVDDPSGSKIKRTESRGNIDPVDQNDPETKSRIRNNENVDVTPATLPKTMEDIYNKAKNLTGNNITEQELNNFLSTLDASPESLLEYSKLIDVLLKYESGTKDLKAILDICNAKQLSVKDMNSLMEIAIDSMADPKDLFKISYEEVGFFKMAFDRIKVGISVQDFQSFVKTYTEYYGKIGSFHELGTILSSDQEFLKYSARLIEKYGKDPETAELLDIMGDGPIFIPLIEYAKNETDAIYRLKILKARVDLEYTDIDWRLSTKLLDIDINDFNNKMQKLDIILEQLNFDGKPKRDKLKQIINDLLQLDNESFANISKRNLWNIEANDWEKLSTISAIAQLSDIEFNHFKSRGLKVSRENIELAKLTDTEWQNLKKRQLDSGDLDNKRMVLFAKLSEHDWRIVEKYHLEAYKNLGTKEFKYLFSKGEQCIAKLQERKLLKHIGRYDIENIDKFVKMSDAEFSPIIERHLTEAIPNQHYDPEGRVYLTLDEMNRLRLLDENTFNKVWDILSTERGTIRNYLEEAGKQDTYLRPFTVDQAVELAQLSTQELVELKQSGALNTLTMQDLRAFIDILNYVNVKDYNELTTADKKRLCVILVKHNEVLLSHLDFQKFLTEKYGETIIPNGRDGYCELLRKVIRESKIETNPLEKGQQEVFEKALADMASSNAFLRANFDAEGFKLELKYSRDKFMKDVFAALEGLSTSEKQKIMDYYGFEVYMKDGQLVMSGYPCVIKNRPELTSPQGKKVAELVERFAGLENRIIVKDNPVLSKMLNDIFDAFPELKGIIGKVQHGTHSYTVDVHTLKVLQGIMSNPKYKNLSAQDQKILTIATLLHDISIKEGEVDKQHPQNSATEAYQLLQKMSLTESERDSVYKIIKYHDWLEQYNTNADVAPEIAYALRNGNDFQLAAILTEADLKGVQKSDAFWNRYKDTFAKGVTEISAMVKQIQQSQIYIPQTRLPKASQLIPDGVIVTKEVINGHEVTVLHIRKGQDLTKIGMDGISSDDIQLLYHGFSGFQEPKNLELVLSATDRDSDIVLSHSLISSLGQEVYAPYGIISYAPNSNIIAGNYFNLASGYQSDKTISKMVEKFVFGNYRNGRAYFPDKLKSKLNITDDAYIDLWNQISDMTLSELKRYDANLGAIMEEILLETDALRQQTREIIVNSGSESISEFVVEHIQIQAIGCPGGSKYLEGMPEYLLKYAEDNNLVIVSIEH